MIYYDLYCSSFSHIFNFAIISKLRHVRRTFAATGNGSLSLPPRGSARLLWGFLDIRNVRIIEVQSERVGHGYGKTSGNNHRWRFSPKIGWILTRSAIDTIASALFLPSASWPFWSSMLWSNITADTRGLM